MKCLEPQNSELARLNSTYNKQCVKKCWGSLGFAAHSSLRVLRRVMAKKGLDAYRRADDLYPRFREYYSNLCEYVHPNYDGVSQSFSLLRFEEDKTDFGPMLNKTHALYDAFTITLVLALHIYLEQLDSIDDNIQNFIHLCDIDIVKQVMGSI